MMNILLILMGAIQVNNNDVCAGEGSGALPCPGVPTSSIQNALSIAFAIAGAIAVIVIVIAGLRYTISAGNPQEAAKAKNAILYALIGLVFCIFATVIIRFVINKI